MPGVAVKIKINEHAFQQHVKGLLVGKQPPAKHHAPVRILSTSCFTVGMKPFE